MDHVIKILAIILLVVAIFAVMLKNYTNIRNFVMDLIHGVSSVITWWKRRRVRVCVEDDCNRAIKELNGIVPELQMPGVSLEWVSKDESGQVELKENEAIVYLNYQRDNARNILNTTTAYIRKSLLPNSRSYLSEGIIKAIDFTVIRSFLNKSSLKNFLVNPFLEENRPDREQYSDAFEKVTTIDDEGMLTRILLRELTLWGGKIAGHLPKKEHQSESDGLVDFLFEILTRDSEELTPLRYVSGNIKVGVILVAKPETYDNYGTMPYLRRIRAGFASGINTFYLLARNEKIDILSNVYSDLMASGNFTLENGPQEFKDAKQRNVICYCIEVNPHGDMAKDYAIVNDTIANHGTLEVEVEKVNRDSLSCFYHLIPVTIPKEEITDIADVRLFKYYTQGMTLKVEPLALIEKGVIKASVKNTDSNPKRLIDMEYTVGNKVMAVVERHQGNLIHLLVKDSDQKAVAYRKNVTYSWLYNLSDILPVGAENEYVICGIDYIYNTLELKLSKIADPWDNLKYRVGQQVQFCQIEESDTYYSTELEPGLRAILPYAEMSWIRSEIEQEKRKYIQLYNHKARIKQIIPEKRLIILTRKQRENPFDKYFKSISHDGVADVYFLTCDSYGINGMIEGKYEVFIPFSETHIGTTHFKYELGSIYPVKLKELSERGNSFVGTLKPFIKTPLLAFSESNPIGTIVKVGKPSFATEKSVYYTLSVKGGEKIRTSLYIGDISNLCHITVPVEDLIKSLHLSMLVVKNYDVERDRADLSLKRILSANKGKSTTLEYQTPYQAVVIGQRDMKYVVIVRDVWIEGYLAINKLMKPGSEVEVYLAARSGEYPEFFE